MIPPDRIRTVFVCLSKPQKTSRLEGLRAQDTIRFIATALLAQKTATKVSHVRKSADHTEAVPEPSAIPRATGIPAQAKKFPERLPPADGGARPRLRGRQRRGRREGPTLTDAEQCQALTEGREGKLIAARGEQELVELPGRTTRGTEARGKEGSARRERERSQRGSEGGRERARSGGSDVVNEGK